MLFPVAQKSLDRSNIVTLYLRRLKFFTRDNHNCLNEVAQNSTFKKNHCVNGVYVLHRRNIYMLSQLASDPNIPDSS